MTIVSCEHCFNGNYLLSYFSYSGASSPLVPSVDTELLMMNSMYKERFPKAKEQMESKLKVGIIQTNIPFTDVAYFNCDVHSVLLPRNSKEGIRSLFFWTLVLTLSGGLPYCPSHMEMSYHTFGLGGKLVNIFNSTWSQCDNQYVVWIHAGKATLPRWNYLAG